MSGFSSPPRPARSVKLIASGGCTPPLPLNCGTARESSFIFRISVSSPWSHSREQIPFSLATPGMTTRPKSAFILVR